MYKCIAMNQLSLHNRIDKIVKNNPSDEMKEEVLDIVNTNFDARNYFFYQADERWLEWLWENDFLKVVTEQPEDTSKYSYTTPEINYLIKVAKVKPEFVVEEIILSGNIATTKEKFNPELIDRILRLCADLEPKWTAKIVKKKIAHENWVKVMAEAGFGIWGFEYAAIFKNLYEGGEYDTILDLAGIVLSLYDKEDSIVKKDELLGTIRREFYIQNLNDTKVFHYLGKLPEEYKEKVFTLLIDKMNELIELQYNEEDKKNYSFRFGNLYVLLSSVLQKDIIDTDIESVHDNKDTLFLFAAKTTVEIFSDCVAENKEKIIEKFDNLIGDYDLENTKLLDEMTTWRLRLFILSLCPEVFAGKIEKYLMRIFDGETLNIDVVVPEYELLLRDYFVKLSGNFRKEYIDKLLELYNKSVQQNKDDENRLRFLTARILCLISAEDVVQSELDIENCKKVDTDIYPAFEGGSEFNFVENKSLVSQEYFDSLSASEIIDKLKTEWSKEELEKIQESPFVSYVEGVAHQLQKSVAKRPSEFIEHANEFLISKEILRRYKYAFIEGVISVVEQNKELGDLAKLFDAIVDLVDKVAVADKKSFENDEADFYNVTWTSILGRVTNLLKNLLIKEEYLGDETVFVENRNKLFKAIKTLLAYPDPAEDRENPEKTKYDISDPFTLAINSVQGKAFELFVVFVFYDYKYSDILKEDVKDLYLDLIKNVETRSITFLLAHELRTFYFRDSKWTQDKVLPSLFDENRGDLFVAATEGYLSQILYKEMCNDSAFRKLYEAWIKKENLNYKNKQKHWKDPNKALAIHLALAFIHFDIEFNESAFSEDLLNEFWNTDNPNNIVRYKEFISFIGNYLRKEKKAIAQKNKFLRFWKWSLSIKERIPSEVYASFSHWISDSNDSVFLDEEILPLIAKSIQYSEGKLDWSHGIMKSLVRFAKTSPENTFSIIRYYLLDKNDKAINKHRQSFMLYLCRDIKDALHIIYQNADEKFRKEISDFTSKLLEVAGDRSQEFWCLKDVVNEK